MAQIKLNDSRRNQEYIFCPFLRWSNPHKAHLIMGFYKQNEKNPVIINLFGVKRDVSYREKFNISYFYYANKNNFLDDRINNEKQAKLLGYNSLLQWVATRYHDMNLFDEVYYKQDEFGYGEFESIDSLQDFFQKKKIKPKEEKVNVRWNPVGLAITPAEQYKISQENQEEWNDFLDYFYGRSKINPFF